VTASRSRCLLSMEYMPVRIEVIHNRKRVCVSGIGGDGVLSAHVTYVKHPNEEPSYELSVGGIGQLDPKLEESKLLSWPSPEIAVGDEITIRVLPPGDFDLPQGMTKTPSASVDDSVFGKLDYNINAWDGDVEIACDPFSACHVHLWSNTEGPSGSQRQRFTKFIAKHDDLWPTIAESLMRCHTQIHTVAELFDRIHPRICINMSCDDNDIEISYSVDGDPEFRAYFIKLRNWEIAEACTAD
jgi:hypothetical protein